MLTAPDDTGLSGISAVQQSIPSDELNGYDEFMNWRKTWNINSFTEEVFIEFFREVTETLGPKTHQRIFTTLRKGMKYFHNVNIIKLPSLMDFLVRNESIAPKKRKIFCEQKRAKLSLSADQISKFLTEAPDAEYLAIKVSHLYIVQ